EAVTGVQVRSCESPRGRRLWKRTNSVRRTNFGSFREPVRLAFAARAAKLAAKSRLMSELSEKKSMDEIMALCKRRGFIFQASEIYGGINGFWDYGPLGAQLKKNLKDAWWQDTVLTPPAGPDGRPLQIVGLDSCIIQNPRVWQASGHVGGFNDPM